MRADQGNFWEFNLSETGCQPLAGLEQLARCVCVALPQRWLRLLLLSPTCQNMYPPTG